MAKGSAVSGAHRPACENVAERDAADGTARHELEALLVASGRGDRQAFARLYRRTSGRLYAVIGRSVWHRAEADDVLQELYVRVWHHAADYNPARSHPMAWLGRIARNLAIDHLRRASPRTRHEAGHASDEPDGIDHAADDGPGPAEQFERMRLCEQARALLAALSSAQQRVILLTFWNGLTQTEVAQALDLPVGTVKSSIRRALMAMREASDHEAAARERRAAARRAAASAALRVDTGRRAAAAVTA